MEIESIDAIRLLCARLEIPDKVASTAREILEDLLQKCPEEFACHDNLGWYSCLLYTVSVDKRFPYGLSDPLLRETCTVAQINLTQLLHSAEMSVKVFFLLMGVIREYCFLSDAVLQTVRRLEKNYCIATALYSKLDKILPCVLIRTVDPTTLSEHLQLADYKKKKDVCWSMFLVSRADLVPSEQELSSAFNILLCCVMEIIIATPSFLLHSPFDEIQRQNSLDMKLNKVSILRTLSVQFSANWNDVIQIYEQYWTDFVTSLKRDEGSYDVESLHKTYLSSYECDVDVNALTFLDYDKLLYPEDLWSGQLQRSDQAPHTPVTTVLRSVQHLDDIIQDLGDEPSDNFLIYCKNCSENPYHTIVDRLSSIGCQFVDAYRTTVGNDQDKVCVQRFKSVMKLYYHILELLLKMEEEKVGHNDFTVLLNQEVFHRSLLACSLEVVLVSHRLTYNPLTGGSQANGSSLSFPWVLSIAGISAYDFYKVIESFIKAEVRLANDLIKHLQRIENEILESIAWKEDSPLFDAIERAQGQYLSSVLLAASPAKPAGDMTAHYMFSSPRPVRTQATSGEGPSKSPSKDSETKSKSISLNLFYNKVSRLAYHRLDALCDKLDIDKEQQRRIWTCLQHCITHKPDLLKRRHLDQVLLCCTYSVCKVSNMEIKFKTIVNAYRRLENTSSMTYKAVLIGDGVYDSIIGFYNDVFLEPMKKTILDFSPQRTTPQLSPVPSMKQPRQPSTNSSSPGYSVSGRRNFYISPLKTSPFKIPVTPSRMTPRTKLLYSFGEGLGSSGVLRSINDSMRQLKRLKFHNNAQTPRSLKRLKFDAEPDGSATNSVEGRQQQQQDVNRPLFSRRLAETRVSSPLLSMEDED